MSSDIRRSPSLLKSFGSGPFRRNHAKSTSVSNETPSPDMVRPRAATAVSDEPKSDKVKLWRRGSVREMWNDKSPFKLSRKTSRRTASTQERIEVRHGYPDDFSFQHRTVCSIYSGSEVYKPLTAHPPPNRMATLGEKTPIRSLREADLRKMFHGAPLFAVTGARDNPRPRATYRDQDPDSTLDGRDVLDFQHSSFEKATLQSPVEHDTPVSISGAPDIIELPSMCGLHGLEPGTTGLDHFLQSPLSSNPSPVKDSTSYPKRVVLQTDPSSVGLRPLQVEHYINRLAELGDIRNLQNDDERILTTSANEQKASEMYADLFTKLLLPPKYSASAGGDTTGLDVQISALIKALKLPGLWHDFSDPKEHLLFGVTIWSALGEPDGVEAVVNRNILLLQITLAAELLTRLDVASKISDDLETVSILRSKITRKVAWDLVLAQRFLQDVCITPAILGGTKDSRDVKRSSLFSMLSFVTARENFEEQDEIQPIVYPRHETAQMNGLLTFAAALDWPHTNGIKQKVADRINQTREVAKQTYAVPVNSTDIESLVGSSAVASLQLSSHTPHANESGILNTSGWLSRTWLTGLLLPGGSAPHLLISALLENSPEALVSLDNTVHLTDGFIYRDRSYWSKSCVAGRVLAALDDVKDCMGWISAPSSTPSQADGWVKVSSQPVTWSKHRINATGLVAASSSLYPDLKSHLIQDSDFFWPLDGPLDTGSELHDFTLTFESSGSVGKTTNNADHNSHVQESTTGVETAIITINLSNNQRVNSLSYPLIYDVHFVASQPCFPRMRTPHSTPRKPAFAAGGVVGRKDKELPPPPCHPILTAYKFTVLPVRALLGGCDERLARFQTREERQGRERQDSGAGRSPRSNNKPEGPGEVPEVLVLDCRGPELRQLLARAWCASVGEHAIIAQAERTCLGCSVREARGLGVGVVVRV